MNSPARSLAPAKLHFALKSLFLAALFALLSSPCASACEACYASNGAAGTRQGDAATWGIIAMTIIMFLMLGAVAGFGFYLNYRAKHPLPDYSDLLAETQSTTPPTA